MPGGVNTFSVTFLGKKVVAAIRMPGGVNTFSFTF
jgi:hypothetical protein